MAMDAEALPAIAAGASAIGGGSTLLTLAATAVSTIGAVSSALYQGKVAENNAEIARNNAALSRDAAAREAQDQDILFQQELGEEVARESASGLSVGSGSLRSRREGMTRINALDRARVIRGGELRAQGFEQEAAQQDAEAGAQRLTAMTSLVGGLAQAGGDIAGGVARVNDRAARRITSGAPRTSPVPPARPFGMQRGLPPLR